RTREHRARARDEGKRRRDELDCGASRRYAPGCERDPREYLRRDDLLEEAHRELGLRRLTEDSVHHRPRQARLSTSWPGGDRDEADATPQLLEWDAQALGERQRFVASPDAQRRVAVGKQPCRPVPFVPAAVPGHQPVPDKPPPEP